MKKKDELADRISRLFAAKELRHVPALLVTAQPNIFYFTGFTGHDSWAVLTPRRSYLFTDGRYTLQARQECPRARILVRHGPMVPFVAAHLARFAIRKLGFLAEEISVGLRDRLSAAARTTRWQKIPSRPITEMRQIKSPAEIAHIRRAIAVAQEAFRGLLSQLKPGLTENEVAAELEYRMRLHGAERAAFETIVAAGPNGAKPHARTSNRKLTSRKLIVFDFGALVNGYASDLTRTVCLGKMPPALKEIYSVCLDAQVQAIQAVRPGTRAVEVDKVAREIIARAGFGKRFNHGLGHGLGLDVHEAPTLNDKSEHVLRPGMIVTVEPGIYLPGQGGVRIEDDVLVTETGHEVLSSLPKTLNDVEL